MLIMQNHRPVQRIGRVFVLCLLALAVVAGTGCNRERREDDRSAEALYADAQRALNNRNFVRAIDLYRNLITRYPFGRHSEQAQLDMAYAQFRARRSEAAITTLDRFIRTHPTHPNIDYAWYLKGLVHYEESTGFLTRVLPSRAVDRDLESARRSFLDFQELIQRHPDSRYVADARQRMVFLRNQLADYEIMVGEYYFRRGAFIAAINRSRYVIETYPGAPAQVDALALMERSLSRLELAELAGDTRTVREHNFGSQPTARERERRGLRRLWPFNF